MQTVSRACDNPPVTSFKIHVTDEASKSITILKHFQQSINTIYHSAALMNVTHGGGRFGEVSRRNCVRRICNNKVTRFLATVEKVALIESKFECFIDTVGYCAMLEARTAIHKKGPQVINWWRILSTICVYDVER